MIVESIGRITATRAEHACNGGRYAAAYAPVGVCCMNIAQGNAVQAAVTLLADLLFQQTLQLP